MKFSPSLFFPFFFEACGRAWRRAVAQTPDEAFQKGLIEDKYAKSEKNPKSTRASKRVLQVKDEKSHAGNQRVPPTGKHSWDPRKSADCKSPSLPVWSHASEPRIACQKPNENCYRSITIREVALLTLAPPQGPCIP